MDDSATRPAGAFDLNSFDLKKIAKDALYFFLVPLTFWITAILGTIQLPGHIMSLNDFIPNNTTQIVMVAWLLNQALNLIKKYIN